MTNCFHCGDDDHLSYDCPSRTRPKAAPATPQAAARPEWCGSCDSTTRLIDHGSYVARCPRCHPLGHVTLPQHKRCGGCRQLVYAWDIMPCGDHQELKGPPAEITHS
jgi:hypothetical protein